MLYYGDVYQNFFSLIVSGEANFDMDTTGLMVGGFIQPSIARNILDNPANFEKGLCQRFLWFFPQSTPIPFDELDKVDQEFSSSVAKTINIKHSSLCTYISV